MKDSLTQRLAIFCIVSGTILLSVLFVIGIIMFVPQSIWSKDNGKQIDVEREIDCYLSFIHQEKELRIPMSTIQTHVNVSENTDVFEKPLAFCREMSSFQIEKDQWRKLEDNEIVKPKDIVAFAVIGSSHGGIFDKARFRLRYDSSEEPWKEVVEVNKFGQFFIEYEVQEERFPIAVEAQVHHMEYGWN